jgi:Fur family ferric uptake transcriptional regulator
MVFMDKIYETLRSSGFRLTIPRRAIIETIVAADGWQRPEEILLRSRDRCSSLGLVTVYRTLSLLSDLGFVRRVHLDHGCHGYVRTELTHGHHVLCRNCHQAVEFAGLEAFSSIIEQVSNTTGYLIENHMIELLGLCPDCQEILGDNVVNSKEALATEDVSIETFF